MKHELTKNELRCEYGHFQIFAVLDVEVCCAAQSTKTTGEVVLLCGTERLLEKWLCCPKHRMTREVFVLYLAGDYSRSCCAVRSTELLEKYWFCPGQKPTREVVLLPGAQDSKRSSCAARSTRLLKNLLCWPQGKANY